jgi:hypothetical protein
MREVGPQKYRSQLGGSQKISSSKLTVHPVQSLQETPRMADAQVLPNIDSAHWTFHSLSTMLLELIPSANASKDLIQVY